MKMIMKILICAILFCGCESTEKDSTYYQNPVFEPDLADPTVIKANDGWFYAYGTENTWEENNHQVVPVIKSSDLVNWKYVGQAFSEKPDWKDGWIWAPNINYINGEYVLYYSFSLWGDENPAIGLAVSDKPEGPFEDKGKLIDSEGMGVHNSIDPFLFQEGDEKYLFWGSLGGGIYGVQLSSDGRSVTGQKFQVAGNSFEGSYIYKKEGYYYLFVSTATCCEGANSVYRVVVGRGENFKGPYLNENGKNLMVFHNMWWPPEVDKIDGVILQGTSYIAGPGHNAEIITDDNGDDWFVYHAIEKSEPYLPKGATRRPLFIDRIEWINGWPVINQGNGPSYEERPIPYFSK
jgi:arabinan endo-1,5-alpha-L-arabinosidase